MELKEFISDAITQICEGVKDAQIKCDNVGARVSPPMRNDRIVEDRDLIHWKYTNILFKVALQSNDNKCGKSGIGVLLANVTLGASKENVQPLSSVTSLEFSVPVALPLHSSHK